MSNGTVRLLTPDERRERRVNWPGAEMYVINLQMDHGLSEDIVLLRAYDIYTDTFPCRAFSPLQLHEALGRLNPTVTPVADRRALPPDGPDIGADVPGGGAI